MNIIKIATRFPNFIKFIFLGTLIGMPTGAIAAALNLPDTPLFLSNINVPPLVMLTMSRDHQYFFKAYNDYNDLDGDGVVDTTYKHSFDYYGYFDPDKCYDYNTSSKRFVPQAFTTDKYCDAVAGDWSGNFLNWATMTRMDIVRKILYGGKRSTDNSTTTVLERAFLPEESHSFAKYYNGSDIPKLTPFTQNSGGAVADQGITICNTTYQYDGSSQTSTADPLIRVAQGDYSLWSSNERYQCTWSNEHTGGSNGTNANIPASSGLNAHSSDPVKSSVGLGQDDYVARVEVCSNSTLIAADTDNNENCRQYPDGNYKPSGLLQTFSEDDDFEFGLVSGSYNKNKSGGVLRKNIGSMADEVNVDTNGTFKAQPSTGGIVGFLDAIRMYGYDFNPGYYNTGAGDSCGFQQDSYNEGNCKSWGNPISEIFLEALHYFAGDSATSAFNTDDSSVISGLKTATFSDPLNTDNRCATLSTLVFNASVASYDGDQTSTTLGGTSIDATTLTNTVGDGEGITGNNYFVGENGTDNDKYCTAKTVSAFGDVRGFCPEAPTEEGSYHIAGLAHYAFTNDLRSDLDGDQTVRTYAVALATNVPEIDVDVDGTHTVKILPAYRITGGGRNGAGQLVNFRVVQPRTETAVGSGIYTAKFYVNWEDSIAGGDYDQDMWGTIEYELDTNPATPTVEVRTDVIAESTNQFQFFGFVINGTTEDGFHAFSGIENGPFLDPLNDPAKGGTPGTIPDCSSSHANSTSSDVAINGTDPTGGDNNCDLSDPKAAHIFTVDTTGTSAGLLEDPLFYAAKWGNFEDSDGDKKPLLTSEWDTEDEDGNAGADGIPDNFFYVTNPSTLQTRLQSALEQIQAVASASATSVAVNTTTLQTETRLYKATFSSFDWSGALSAFAIDPTDGSVASSASWTASLPSAASRNIFTTVDKSGTPTPIAFTDADSDLVTAVGSSAIINYIRGDQSNEVQNGGIFRDRSTILGDIVNSSPVSVSNQDFAYDSLPSTEGSTYSAYVAAKTALYTGANNKPFNIVAVGANDGMLHIFKDTEDTVPATAGQEVMAYVPSQVHANLSDLTNPSYNHEFFVDATPSAGDAYINSAWRTILVGSLGKGGKGIYALNITDPFTFSTSDVMWEFDTSDSSELGYVMHPPVVTRLNNGKWGVIFGNGYNSTSQTARLFILDAEDGSIIKIIDTQVGSSGSPNALGRPFLLDENTDRITDTIYAGDLQGNLWKFDLSGSNPTQWDVAIKQGNTPKPLYTAVDDNGTVTTTDDTVQPITTRPTVVSSPDGGFIVLFGTGKYLEPSDAIISASPQVETFYGIHDDGGNANLGSGRNNLQEQSILEEIDLVDANNNVFGTGRIVTDTTVDYSSKDGWFMDLVSPVNGKEGERVISNPVTRFGRVIFNTFIPLGACENGGKSFIMELDAVSGKRLENATFDANNDGVIDANDTVTDSNGNPVVISGYGVEGTLGDTAFVQDSSGSSERKLTQSMTGGVTSTLNGLSGVFVGRQSWRQLE